MKPADLRAIALPTGVRVEFLKLLAAIDAAEAALGSEGGGPAS